jgi:hypothetical protein
VFAAACAPKGTAFDEAVYSAAPPFQPLVCRVEPDPTPPPTPRPRALTGLRIAPKSFRPARRGPSIARARGAIVSYAASAAGPTHFSVRRSVVRRGRACGFKSPTARKRPCRRWKHVNGSFTHHDVEGPNRFRFTGRLKKALRRGRYLLAAVPAAADHGKAGTAKHATFRVLGAQDNTLP